MCDNGHMTDFKAKLLRCRCYFNQHFLLVSFDKQFFSPSVESPLWIIGIHNFFFLYRSNGRIFSLYIGRKRAQSVKRLSRCRHIAFWLRKKTDVNNRSNCVLIFSPECRSFVHPLCRHSTHPALVGDTQFSGIEKTGLLRVALITFLEKDVL